MDSIIRKIKHIINKVSQNQISWKAPEFIYYKKTVWWYIIVILLGLGLGALFYYLDDLLAIIAVLLTMLVLIILGNQKPKEKNYILSTDGITIDNQEFAYSNFKSFYVTYLENTATLHLEKIKKISAPINMLLINVDENLVIKFIGNYLAENTKINYSGGDIISKWFRF